MDRREALKKIGIGGATVATASVIVSSPAFAFDAPTAPNQPEVTVFTNGEIFGIADLNVSVGPGTPTCNASASGGASVVAVSQTSSATGSATASPTSGSAVNTPLNVVFDRSGGGAFSPATATINYRARYRCTYASPTNFTDVCRSWTITFVTAPGILGSDPWNTTPTISTPGTNCP